jgi:choice-of-anchor B domain-containing protein
MTRKPIRYRKLFDREFKRIFIRILWVSIVVSTAAGLPFAARADDPDSAHNHATGAQKQANSLGHLTGSELEVKRLKKTGKGMPSITGPFPDTDKMLLLGQLTNEEMGVSKLVFTGASFLSDIWGWTSEGEEYAIVGTSSGVAFVRITDPVNPEFLGLVPTTDTTTTRNFWWDIKTYENYAYWVTEVNGAGVAIFDLNRLKVMGPVSADTTLKADERYQGGGYIRAHNISINEATGFAYLTGASKDPAVDSGFTDDGVIILDLKLDLNGDGGPLAPVEVGQILNIDSHDAQIVSYRGPDVEHEGREIAVIFNGTDLEVGIYDVTDKGGIETLSVTTYAGASFTHQGWLTEDQRYMLMGDEEDELFGVSDPKNPDLPKTTRTYIWDLYDLDNPKMTGTFDSPEASIDHNLFVMGNRVYQANYTAGIRVLAIDIDGDGVLSLSEVAHMDTEPRLPTNHMNHNINIFVGPWGVYPFFDSGKIIASDGLNGLIITQLSE